MLKNLVRNGELRGNATFLIVPHLDLEKKNDRNKLKCT